MILRLANERNNDKVEVHFDDQESGQFQGNMAFTHDPTTNRPTLVNIRDIAIPVRTVVTEGGVTYINRPSDAADPKGDTGTPAPEGGAGGQQTEQPAGDGNPNPDGQQTQQTS